MAQPYKPLPSWKPPKTIEKPVESVQPGDVLEGDYSIVERVEVKPNGEVIIYGHYLNHSQNAEVSGGFSLGDTVTIIVDESDAHKEDSPNVAQPFLSLVPAPLIGVAQDAILFDCQLRGIAAFLEQHQAPQELSNNLLAASREYIQAVQSLCDVYDDPGRWHQALATVDATFQTCTSISAAACNWINEHVPLSI